MIRQFIAAILNWWKRPPAAVKPSKPKPDVRVHIPRSVLHELRRATKPTRERFEPLAFLRVRYASENVKSVLVAVGVIAFPDHAYVEGDAGANFDTGWAVEIANREVISNAGLLLAHRHGGRGKPGFSSIDAQTNRTVMLQLSIGVPFAPYGAVVLSDDAATVVVAEAGRLVEAAAIVVPDALGRMDLTA